jgi:uncharacterized protein YjbI with pentapeptide repeats
MSFKDFMTLWVAFWGLFGVFFGIIQVQKQISNQGNQIQIQQKQLRDTRFSSGVELLGNPNESARIGGAYNLYFLAEEFPDEYLNPVCNILCAHIRTITNDKYYQEKHIEKPSNEIQTILDLLFYPKNDRLIFNDCFKDLQGTFLNGTSLEYSTLNYVKLVSAKLSNVNFSEAKLDTVYFHYAEFNNTHFSNSELNNISFSSSKLDSVSFYEARFNDVYFGLAKLNSVDFYHTELNDIQFYDAELNNVNFSGQELPYGAKLNNTTFNRAKLSHIDFGGAKLRNIDFSEAILIDVIFSGFESNDDFFEGENYEAILDSVCFTAAELQNVSFVGAKFTNVDFSWRISPGSSSGLLIDRTRLTNVDFKNTIFENYSYEEITEPDNSLELTQKK